MPRYRSKTSIAIVALTMLGVLTACGANPSEEVDHDPAIDVVSVHRTAKVDWEKSWDSAFSRAKSEGKPMLVSFEAEWCVWCKKLESTTYRDSKVMSLITETLVPLTLDVDGAGEALSDQLRVESLPTILVIAPDGEEKGRINGYLPPARFVEAMNEILQEG